MQDRSKAATYRFIESPTLNRVCRCSLWVVYEIQASRPWNGNRNR